MFARRPARWPLFLLLGAILAIPVHLAAQFELRNPLGWAPLELDNRNGVVIALGALSLSLLLSDPPEAGEVSGSTSAQPWFVTTQGGFFRSYHETPSDLHSVRLGLGRYLRRWLAVGIEFHATRLSDVRLEGGDTGSLGGLSFIRWHPLDTESWTSYFEYGFGLVFTDGEFPPGGTDTNFTPTYGVGLGRKMGRATLGVGVRHWHISNGGAFGGEDNRNPGFDSNGAYFSVQWVF